MSAIEEGDPLDDDDDDSVIGEDEAIWALRLFLPYINEFLLKVKALFLGDLATTMKVMQIIYTNYRSSLLALISAAVHSSGNESKMRAIYLGRFVG
ncbi:hypothetical protein Tco_0519861 [Tanacetum coccineum]